MAFARTLGKMILRDVTSYTFAALAVITPLALALLLMQLVYKLDGIGGGTMLGFIPLLALYYQPYLIPICVLAACAAAYGRFAGDREFTAFMTAGAPPRSILWPSLVIGALMCIPAAWVSFDLAPQIYVKRDRMGREALIDILQNPPPGAREISIPGHGYHLSYRSASDGIFEGLVIMMTDEGKVTGLLSAQSAGIRYSSEGETLSLTNAAGMVYLRFDEHGRLASPVRGDVQLLEYPLPLYNKTGRISPKADRARAHFQYLQTDIAAPFDKRTGTQYEFVRRIGFSIAPLVLALLGALTGLFLTRESRIVQTGVALILGISLFFGLQVAAKAATGMHLPGWWPVVAGIAVQFVPILILCWITLHRVNLAREGKHWTARLPSWFQRAVRDDGSATTDQHGTPSAGGRP